MRIYTAKGDQGQTDLLGERVAKTDPRIELLGTLDEASCAIGLGRAHVTDETEGETLVQVQRDLYQVMAELAFTEELRPASLHFGADRVTWLEAEIERVTNTVQLPPQFVIPGDTVAGAALDVARTVARRAERLAVALSDESAINNPEVLRYLNRLSSLLFILARAEDLRSGKGPRLAKQK